jgi:hypothetical protein
VELIKNVVSTLGVWFHVGHACIGAKGDSYHEMAYNGPSSFVGAAKLVHTEGTKKDWSLMHDLFDVDVTQVVIARLRSDICHPCFPKVIPYPRPAVADLTQQ